MMRMTQRLCAMGRKCYLRSPLSRNFSTGHGRNPMHSTTILAIRKGNEVVMFGDGQVTLGSTIIKNDAKKVRVLDFGLESQDIDENMDDQPDVQKSLDIKYYYDYYDNYILL